MRKETKEILDKMTAYAKDHFNIDITKVNGIRKGPYVRVRASIMVTMMRVVATKSVELAEAFNVDHTSVLHHKTNHLGRYQSDDEYAEVYDTMFRYVTKLRSEIIGEDSAELPKVLTMIRNVAS